MNRCVLRGCGAAFLLVACSLHAQEPRPLGPVRVASQVVAGTAALPAGYIVGGLATRRVARALGADADAASQAAYVGAYVGAALGTAGAVSLVGARGPGHGSYPAAVGGAAAGGLASVLVVRALRKDDDREARPCKLACVAVSAVVALLPSIGATVAYDVSRSR